MSDGLALTADPTMLEPKSLEDMRADLKMVIKANFRQILVDALADKVGHAMAVAGGIEHFRIAFGRAMGTFFTGNLAKCDDLAEVGWRFLQHEWSAKYKEYSAGQFLDMVHVESPETDKEFEQAVEDGWELEIGGSSDALKQFYYGEQRVRKGADIFSTSWQRGPESKKG